MNSNNPLVSIVIPLYNGENFISKTIKSVLKQTYLNFELIIIDDNSTDNSLLIARSFNDQRIKIISNNFRLGFFKNWNFSLNQITGKYGKILPHDDLLEPSCIEKQVTILEKYKNLSFVHCGRKIINFEGKIILEKIPKYDGISDLKTSIREVVLSGTNPFGEPGAVLFRSSIIKIVGSFCEDDKFTIDIDYWIRLLNFGERYSQNEILCSFRIWKGSESVKIQNYQSSSMINFYNKISNEYPGYLKKYDLKIGYIKSKINKIIRILIYKIIDVKSN